MLRGIMLFALGYAIANRLEKSYGKQTVSEKKVDSGSRNDGVDVAIEDSFPASDPPSFNAGVAHNQFSGPH